MANDLETPILDAALARLQHGGWAAMTVAAVAADAGVSRQQVYRAIGDRQQLGRRVLMREVQRFIQPVLAAHRAHPDDAVRGISSASATTLAAAADNLLIKALIAGQASPLLPWVALESGPVLEPVLQAVTASALAIYGEHHSPAALTRAIEVSVRLTISHLLQPTSSQEDAVAQIHDTIAALLSLPGA